MDRIFSARIDDKIAKQIADLAKRLHTTKKAVIEKAIELLGYKVEAEKGIDVFDRTCGIWKREETAGETVFSIRTSFRKSMHRYEK